MDKNQLEELKNEISNIIGDQNTEISKDLLEEVKIFNSDNKRIKLLFDKISQSSELSYQELKLLRSFIENNKKIDQLVMLLKDKDKQDSNRVDLLLKTIEKLKIDLPEKYQVEVLNKLDLKSNEIKVINKIKLDEPEWFNINEIIDRLTEKIGSIVNGISNKIFRVKIVDSGDPERPIAVRLSDGQRFYKNIIQSIISSGGGGGVSFKKANGQVEEALIDSDRHVQVDIQTTSPVVYEYCGVQSSGGYTYIGFKKYTNGSWKIMRITDADTSEVKYAYGTTGYATAWATPAGESYNLPPDS